MNGRCPTYRCGEIMDPSTDGNGRTVWTCRLCERTKAGICIDCPRVVAPRRRRCDPCQARTNKANETRRGERRNKTLKFWARAYRATPEGRAASAASNAKYAAKNPITDLDRIIRRIRGKQRRELRQKVAA
jgi:hypothetical protein